MTLATPTLPPRRASPARRSPSSPPAAPGPAPVAPARLRPAGSERLPRRRGRGDRDRQGPGDVVKESIVTAGAPRGSPASTGSPASAAPQPPGPGARLERVERLYRARGFYEAHVRAGQLRLSSGKVRVEIVVEEGPPVVVDRREITTRRRAAARRVAVAAEAAAGGVKIGAPVEEAPQRDQGEDRAGPASTPATPTPG